MRLDAELVRRLDALAEVEGLSRTAVIERLARREFNAVRVVSQMNELPQLVAAVVGSFRGDTSALVECLVSASPAFQQHAKRSGKGRS